jgi:predicted nuclease of predicted toxin-antitoxin system
MKILLDECVPWPMHRLLDGHECTSVQDQGWSGIRNSDLLQRAEAEFDLLITSDQNIRYQQNLAARRIPILELSTNDLRRIQAASPLIKDAVEKMQPSGFKHRRFRRGALGMSWSGKRINQAGRVTEVFVLRKGEVNPGWHMDRGK